MTIHFSHPCQAVTNNQGIEIISLIQTFNSGYQISGQRSCSNLCASFQRPLPSTNKETNAMVAAPDLRARPREVKRILLLHHHLLEPCLRVQMIPVSQRYGQGFIYSLKQLFILFSSTSNNSVSRLKVTCKLSKHENFTEQT